MLLLNNKYSEGFNQEHLEVKQLALRYNILSLTTMENQNTKRLVVYISNCALKYWTQI